VPATDPEAWSFRLRFDLGDASNLPLDGEEWLIDATQTRRMVLKPADGTESLRAARRVQLAGHGFETEEGAEREGNRWRDRLTLVFMSCGIGADFGDRAASGFASDHALRRASEAAGVPVLNDKHGLMTFPSPPPVPLTLRVGPVTATIAPSREQFVQTAESLIDSQVILSGRDRVAYDLFSASFSMITADARFIMLMMAVETLLDPRPRSAEAQDLVRSLISATEQSSLPKAEVDSLVGSLEWLLQDSISRTGRALAKRLGDRRYQDETPSKFFTECYDLRSKLTHGHLPRPDRDMVGARAANLQLFLSDLMWTVAAQADVVT
jgi:hypothetical protein